MFITFAQLIAVLLHQQSTIDAFCHISNDTVCLAVITNHSAVFDKGTNGGVLENEIVHRLHEIRVYRVGVWDNYRGGVDFARFVSWSWIRRWRRHEKRWTRGADYNHRCGCGRCRCRRHLCARDSIAAPFTFFRAQVPSRAFESIALYAGEF